MMLKSFSTDTSRLLLLCSSGIFLVLSHFLVIFVSEKHFFIPFGIAWTANIKRVERVEWRLAAQWRKQHCPTEYSAAFGVQGPRLMKGKAFYTPPPHPTPMTRADGVGLLCNVVYNFLSSSLLMLILFEAAAGGILHVCITRAWHLIVHSNIV